MKKIYASLFCCTLLSSSIVCAQNFKGECLEMLCDYKCSEDASGRGKCCSKPTKTNCKVEMRDSFGCVVSSKVACPSSKPMCKDDGTCWACTKSSDCPDLHTYCLNGACVPCNNDRTGVRPSVDAEYCDCPEGFTKKCGSTKASISCQDGGRWTCVNGCFSDADCPTDEYCTYTSGSTPGKCQPCPAGQHRSEDAATKCIPCGECEEWVESEQKCVSMCAPGQLCLQMPGGSNKQKCNGDLCVSVPAQSQLVHIKGALNGRDYYLPPAQNQYKMTHTSASRFCEHYGMHLASVTEACAKDYAYDTGYDCPNISKLGLNQYHVDGMGSFWLANINGTDALRATYSCGNNHSTGICNSFYPLCTKD